MSVEAAGTHDPRDEMSPRYRERGDISLVFNRQLGEPVLRMTRLWLASPWWRLVECSSSYKFMGSAGLLSWFEVMCTFDWFQSHS
jgi:hypothetical protein